MIREVSGTFSQPRESDLFVSFLLKRKKQKTGPFAFEQVF
jgi:hypothetical protein